MTLCAAFLFSVVASEYKQQAGGARSPLRRGEGQQQLLVQVLLPQHTEEVQLLLGLLYQGDGGVGPGEVGGDVGAQKPEGGDRFNLFFIYNESGPVCAS